MARRKKISKEPVHAHVEALSHDGRGIARVDGKTTFIQGALPGEDVSFVYTRVKKDFADARVITVENDSDERVRPKCSHFEVCGGCSLQHLNHESQIKLKNTHLFDLLDKFGKCSVERRLEPLTDDVWHYRNKARLSVRYVEKKQDVLVGFRERNNSRFIADIQTCAILNSRVSAELVNLRLLINSFANPKVIAQIEVASSDDEVALIFRNLEELTGDDEEKLIAFAKDSSIKIFLQPGGPDTVTLFYPPSSGEYLTYSLPFDSLTYKFHPTDFTQVNFNINQKMVGKALELLDLSADDRVLDLYCGLGNFSLAIAKHCALVIGIEGTLAMVERASMNARDNGITNTNFACANLEDENEIRMLKGKRVNKLLIDPPRVGAQAVVSNIDIINPERIVYVSCNPATLARDADILVNKHGYKLRAAGIMDMFPHTQHVESIALFIKSVDDKS